MGPVGGADTQVFFNDSGLVGATGAFTYTEETGTLNVNNIDISSGNTMSISTGNGDRTVNIFGQSFLSTFHSKTLNIGSVNALKGIVNINGYSEAYLECNSSLYSNSTTRYGVGFISAGSYFNTNAFSLLDSNTTKINAFGAGTEIAIGATTGYTRIRNDLRLGGATGAGSIKDAAGNNLLTFSSGDATIENDITIQGNTTSNEGYRISSSAITGPTGPYTLVVADNGKVVSISSSSATTVTVTTGVGTKGFTCVVMSVSSGLVTLEAASGVTLNSYSGLTLDGAYAAATLICYDSNTFNVIGSLV
jgi:hypothetical protein